MSYTIGLDISALDPNFKEHSTRGIGRYAKELKKNLELRKDKQDYRISYFNHNELIKNSKVAKLLDKLPKGRVTAKQQVLYPLKLGTLKHCQTLHFLAQTDAPSWSPIPYIVSVMDVIPLVCADMYKASNPNWKFHLARFLEKQAIKNAKKIITISECSKRDIIKFYDINPDDIFVTPLGVDSEHLNSDFSYDINQLKAKFDIPENKNFLLYVGGIDQRKNLSGLLDAYKELLNIYQENSEANPPLLLLAGKISQDKEYQKLQNQIQELDLTGKVLETGFVSDEDLKNLYHACQAFCFLSLYEGFGLTPLEAMANGAAVLSSNTSAMPEVLGDAAMYTDPTDPLESAKKLYELLHNQELRDKLKAKGKKQVAKFSWDKTAKLTEEVYRVLAG